MHNVLQCSDNNITESSPRVRQQYGAMLFSGSRDVGCEQISCFLYIGMFPDSFI